MSREETGGALATTGGVVAAGQEEERQRHTPTPTTPRTSLRSTSLAYLVEDMHITSDLVPPRPVASLPQPWKPSKRLLMLEPKSATEALLQHELRAMLQALAEACQSAVTSHTMMALQGAYVVRVKGQLAAEERKRQQGKVKKTRLLGDGCTRVLTNNAFYLKVVAWEAAVAAEELAKEGRKDARAAHKQAVGVWNGKEAVQKLIMKGYCGHMQWSYWSGRRSKMRPGRRNNAPSGTGHLGPL